MKLSENALSELIRKRGRGEQLRGAPQEFPTAFAVWNKFGSAMR